MDFSKMKAGKLKYFFKIKTLSSAIEETAKELSVLSKKKDVELVVSKPQFDDPTSLDYEKICQVIRNLLPNAIKFSNKNSIINLDIEDQNESLMVSVAD